MNKAYYNDNDKRAVATLKELIRRGLIAPGDVDDRSIEDVTPADVLGYTQAHFFAGAGVWSYALRKAGWSDDRPVWTGSCPCQPFSQAGKRKGTSDERHLFPAWFHLIRVCKPVTIFGEQVGGSDGLTWLDAVLFSLEREGYTVGATDTPSASFGAPHKRNRIYFVAHAERRTAKRHRPELGEEKEGDSGFGEVREGTQRIRVDAGDGKPTDLVAHAEREGTRRGLSAFPRCDGEDNGVSGENRPTDLVAHAASDGHIAAERGRSTREKPEEGGVSQSSGIRDPRLVAHAVCDAERGAYREGIGGGGGEQPSECEGGAVRGDLGNGRQPCGVGAPQSERLQEPTEQEGGDHTAGTSRPCELAHPDRPEEERLRDLRWEVLPIEEAERSRQGGGPCNVADTEHNGSPSPEERRGVPTVEQREGREEESGGVFQPSAGSPVRGPCNGFWANAEWVPCRNPKIQGAIEWRPIEPGTFALAHGASARVGRLHLYGNAIVAPQAEEFIRAFRRVRGEE